LAKRVLKDMKAAKGMQNFTRGESKSNKLTGHNSKLIQRGNNLVR
jgi:hypothetical protein